MESKKPSSKQFLINPAQIKRKPGDNCLCLKCSHTWFSSKLYLTGIAPATCSRCHRYDWQEPRVRAFKAKKHTSQKTSERKRRN